MKRFEYLPLGKELKAQTDLAKKQDEFKKIINKENPILKK